MAGEAAAFKGPGKAGTSGWWTPRSTWSCALFVHWVRPKSAHTFSVRRA